MGLNRTHKPLDRKAREEITGSRPATPSSRRRDEPVAGVGTPLFLQRSPLPSQGGDLSPRPLDEEDAIVQAKPASFPSPMAPDTEEEDEKIIQAQLTVGSPGDLYEQEADRFAQQAAAAPKHAVPAAPT
jgi:hypothetical protein